ncbi:MAG: nitroreductase family protein [Actinomycetota bacterium]
MDTWKTVNAIRVVREFDDHPIPDRDVHRIVNAGRRAGSSKNLQRWGFIVVRDKPRLQRLATAGPWAMHVGGAGVAIALVTPDPSAQDSPLSVTWDLGRAAQNMVLVAWELGIGSCPATVYDHELVRQELAIPADQHCEYLLSFGYPADTALFDAPNRAGGRRSVDEVLHDESW